MRMKARARSAEGVDRKVERLKAAPIQPGKAGICLDGASNGVTAGTVAALLAISKRLPVLDRLPDEKMARLELAIRTAIEDALKWVA